MKIENIEEIHKNTWLVETKQKAIVFCGISKSEFINQLLLLFKND
jgi:hypothetical protein